MAPAASRHGSRRDAAGHGAPARAALLALLLALGGCEGVQSTLDPQGPAAAALAHLWWVMFWGAVVILALVMGLALYAALRRHRERRGAHERYLIVGGGLVFPVVVLTALLVYGTALTHRLTAPPPEHALRVEVIGKQFWWEVRYPLEDGEVLVTANEIRIPAGQPVEVAVITTDVIHSFWVPNLAGKIDMVPGRVNHVQMRADRPGVYRGQCAEFCGAQHARMAFYVVVETPRDFAAWLDAQRAPATEPATPFQIRGREAFLQAGCGACHTVRGTPAEGRLGPDLTHMGSRLSIGAGTLDNTVGNMAGWIADAQGIKPGNLMPSFGQQLDGESLRAIAAYLEGLQ